MDFARTYSLKGDASSSDAYYQTIARFTDDWLGRAERQLARPVQDFLNELQGAAAAEAAAWEESAAARPERSFAEAAFEMLVLGVLLREHGAQALRLAPAPAWVLTRLIEAQDALPLPAVEKPVKAMRGMLQGLTAPLETGADFEALAGDASAAEITARLLTWLRAAGQATQAEQLTAWQSYLTGLPPQSAEAVLARCLLLAEDFASESQAVLGQYTARVDEFERCTAGEARWRYDSPLITRTTVEYHLGMLGTEILTRAYRARFRAAPRKIVIVPDCLCAHSRRVAAATPDAATCQAVRTDLGGACRECTPGCRVCSLTRLGQQRGFEVYILPDDLRGMGLSACSRLEGVGVVGVACALTNWDAGWMVNAKGVACQGVLLDYAGCRSHWHPQGIATDVNLRKVLDLIEN
jgi:hypothetical protein